MSETRSEQTEGGPPQPADAHLEALIAAVTARYGAHIQPDQMDRLRETVTGLRDASVALAAYPLANGDEPDATFAAWQGED
jgi:hypothetical protein